MMSEPSVPQSLDEIAESGAQATHPIQLLRKAYGI